MIYFISDNNGFVKIGVADDVEQRLRQLQTSNAHKLTILRVFKRFGYSYKKYDDYKLERLLHAYFQKYNADPETLNSEWFYEKPILELINKTDDEFNSWLKNELNITDAEYLAYERSLRKRYIQNDVERLKLSISKKNQEIKCLKEDNNFLREQVDMLSKRVFKEVHE